MVVYGVSGSYTVLHPSVRPGPRLLAMHARAPLLPLSRHPPAVMRAHTLSLCVGAGLAFAPTLAPFTFFGGGFGGSLPCPALPCPALPLQALDAHPEVRVQLREHALQPRLPEGAVAKRVAL